MQRRSDRFGSAVVALLIPAPEGEEERKSEQHHGAGSDRYGDDDYDLELAGGAVVVRDVSVGGWVCVYDEYFDVDGGG